MTDLQPVYATYEEAARLLRCSKKTVARKVRAGELEARGAGRGRRVVLESVLRHPERRQENAHGTA